MRGRRVTDTDERAIQARPLQKPEQVGGTGPDDGWNGLLELQGAAGNAAVAKLVSAPGAGGPCACGGSGGDCACEGRDGEDGRGGEPLDAGTRANLESRFGQDLADVRVHTGADAAASARAVDARAYADGKDIVFAAGAYKPGTAEGQRLLAHEVAHTLQTEGPAASPGPVSQPRDTAEVAATQAAEAVASGRPPPAVGARPVGVLHRQAEDEEGAALEPIADASGVGPEKEVEAMASVSLPGLTTASFSSSFVTQGATQRRGEGGCNVASGTLVNTFTVGTTVTLPPVPDSLTECQRANAQRFIDTILSPHEQEHVTAFNTYNGTSSRPFSVTICPGEDFATLVQAEHDTDAQARQAAAQALSDALDPFNVDVDIDEGCEAPAE